MQPVTDKRWELRENCPEMLACLARDAGISPLTARILVSRGITDSLAVSRHLSAALMDMHDPFLMLDMDKAVERIVVAVRRNERICVYGDYDVDGVTSVALLIHFFRVVGIDCFYHIPNRLEDGYGLSADCIRSVASRGAAVIISVDCGITAIAEAQLCLELGVDLIITDHHTPGEKIPDACAVLNPHREGCAFPFKALAGVGVAFNLLVALRGKLRESGFFKDSSAPNLREYLDLVALGTVADVVPLLDENRIFVKYGLNELTVGRRTGVKALKTVAGVTGDVGYGAVGFRLAPRLNAAGRLEDAALGVELLLENDPARAAAMAAELDAGNAERQALEREILHDALEMVKNSQSMRGRKSIVLASDEWHPGVIGIVASRLVDLYHRPTIMIALKDGSGKGSGRSIPGFHLYDALKDCSGLLEKFGGHKYAAGLAVDEDTLERFVERFDEIASGLLSTEDLTPVLYLDAELEPEHITMELASMLVELEPFGMGNPEPVFLLRDLQVVDRRILQDRHVKLKLSRNGSVFEAIGFNMADRKDVGEFIDVAFSLEINIWNGRKSLQLRLKDQRRAGA